MADQRKMPKNKQVHKTKEQLLSDLKNNEQFKAKMAFTREKFYPALVEASTSIEDAMTNLSSINTVVMQTFLGFMKEKKFGELDMVSKMDEKAPKFEEIKAMLALFNEMSVFEAKELIEGMRAEIGLWCQEDNRMRNLKDLPKRWIDEL